MYRRSDAADDPPGEIRGGFSFCVLHPAPPSRAERVPLAAARRPACCGAADHAVRAARASAIARQTR
jgi:hypothetical protein